MMPAAPVLRPGTTAVVMGSGAGCTYVYVSVVRLMSKCQAAAGGSFFTAAVPTGVLDIADGDGSGRRSWVGGVLVLYTQTYAPLSVLHRERNWFLVR